MGGTDPLHMTAMQGADSEGSVSEEVCAVKAPCRSASSFLRFLSGALQQECGLQLPMRHRL